MNLTQQSRHQTQPLIIQITQLMRGFLGARFSYFFTKYSSMNLSIVTIAISIDPKASDPKWYLKAHLTPVLTSTEFLAWAVSDPWPEKYQRQAVHAIVNYWIAMMKAIIQKKPKRNNQKRMFSSLDGSKVANISFFTYLGVPILYKKTMV